MIPTKENTFLYTKSEYCSVLCHRDRFTECESDSEIKSHGITLNVLVSFVYLFLWFYYSFLSNSSSDRVSFSSEYTRFAVVHIHRHTVYVWLFSSKHLFLFSRRFKIVFADLLFTFISKWMRTALFHSMSVLVWAIKKKLIDTICVCVCWMLIVLRHKQCTIMEVDVRKRQGTMTVRFR